MQTLIMKKVEKNLIDKSFQAFLQNGIQAYQADNLIEAGSAFRQALEIDSNHDDANHLLGLVAWRNGENEVAVELMSKAIQINPGNAAYHSNLGNALKDLKRADEAAESYRKALSILPDFASAHSNLGAALRELGQLQDAMNSLQRAIALQPDLASAHVNLGNVLKDMGQAESAVKSFRKALDIEASDSIALGSLVNLIQGQNQLDMALVYCCKAIALNPNCVMAHQNKGEVFYKMGNLKEAEKSYRRALELELHNPQSKVNLSTVLLSMGQLEEGWKHYESRTIILLNIDKATNINQKPNWARSRISRTTADFPQPQWDGSSLAGKRIILWGDQGLGDEVRFASIVPDLQKTEAIITIECDQRLTDIFARSFPDVNIFATPYTGAAEQPDQFDYQCPLAGLARFFRNDYEAFTKDKPGYLKADPALIKLWKKRLSDISDRPKIGLSWNSAVKVPERASIYASIEELAPILNIDGIDFVNLQSQDSSEDIAKAKEKFGIEIHSWDDLDNRNDLNGVAALTSCLDLVISFPCFSSELAGAIGVQTFCFVDHKDSFDELGSKDNIWYPNTHHISKDRNEQWPPVFEKIVEKTRSRLGL